MRLVAAHRSRPKVGALESMGIQREGVETALGLEEGLALLGIEVTGEHNAAAKREAAQ